MFYNLFQSEKFLTLMFSVIRPVKALIIKPEPITLVFGLDSATNFINAFVKINVHFSFYFSDLGNSSLPFSFTGILSST